MCVCVCLCVCVCVCVCVERDPLANESSSTCCSWDMSAGCAPPPGFLGLEVHSGERIRLTSVAVWLFLQSFVPGTQSQQDDLIFVVVLIVVFSSDESEAGFKLFASSVYVRLT